VGDRWAPQNEMVALEVDTPLDLYEIDYSTIYDQPLGTEAFIQRLCCDVQTNGENVWLDGKEFTAVPIEGSGFDLTSQGSVPRPTLVIANAVGLVSSMMEEAEDLRGAQVTRRRIFARHLDHGERPDPTAEWPPQIYRVERKIRDDVVVELELSAIFDVEGAKIPGRLVEWNLCPWTYKSAECGWVPGAGPYFDVNGDPTTEGNDNCGLRLSDCKARFKAREQPLRYGGFPAVVRVVS